MRLPHARLFSHSGCEQGLCGKDMGEARKGGVPSGLYGCFAFSGYGWRVLAEACEHVRANLIGSAHGGAVFAHVCFDSVLNAGCGCVVAEVAQ